MTKVIAIVDVDRAAGYASCDNPPYKYLGKEVTVRRPLFNWHAAWCDTKDGKSYVFSFAELNKVKCDCRDCLKVINLLKKGKGKTTKEWRETYTK